MATGIDVLLRDSLHLVRGRRVGLVTNQTGFGTIATASGPDSTASTVDLLHDHGELELVALYSPEHGLSGQVNAGERVPTARHQGTGLPIYSLYGETNEPLPHMLDGIDVLLFDIQDVGARYYTYVWTMALSMRAAGAAGISSWCSTAPSRSAAIWSRGTCSTARSRASSASIPCRCATA